MAPKKTKRLKLPRDHCGECAPQGALLCLHTYYYRTVPGDNYVSKYDYNYNFNIQGSMKNGYDTDALVVILV